MTESKTVQLPLTKSEQRHLDNVRRRDAKRAQGLAKQTSVAERDAKLRSINKDYGPKIEKLQAERKNALGKVWADWREERSKA